MNDSELMQLLSELENVLNFSQVRPLQDRARRFIKAWCQLDGYYSQLEFDDFSKQFNAFLLQANPIHQQLKNLVGEKKPLDASQTIMHGMITALMRDPVEYGLSARSRVLLYKFFYSQENLSIIPKGGLHAGEQEAQALLQLYIRDYLPLSKSQRLAITNALSPWCAYRSLSFFYSGSTIDKDERVTYLKLLYDFVQKPCVLMADVRVQIDNFRQIFNGEEAFPSTDPIAVALSSIDDALSDPIPIFDRATPSDSMI